MAKGEHAALSFFVCPSSVIFIVIFIIKNKDMRDPNNSHTDLLGQKHLDAGTSTVKVAVWATTERIPPSASPKALPTSLSSSMKKYDPPSLAY